MKYVKVKFDNETSRLDLTMWSLEKVALIEKLLI